MKKLLIGLLIFLVAVPIVLGAVLGISYYRTDDSTVPKATVQAAGKTVQPAGYSWNTPLFGGIMYKKFTQNTTLEATGIGTVTEPQVQVLFPEEYTNRVAVQYEGATVWSGSAAEWDEYVFTENGDYLIEVTSERPSQGASAYGSFVYRFACSVNIEPQLTQSADHVKQGDVLAIEVYNLTGDLIPAAASEIAGVMFTPSGQGRMTAYVPISYNREPGDYTITVAAGWYNWEVSFKVLAYDFERQDLFMDNSNPVITEANSPAAYQQYRDKIYPIFDLASEDTYWDGMFIRPVEGSISTHYGLYRFTTYSDGSTATSRHAGMDYSAVEGTPVYAPNNGVVVFAETLLNTGNTIVVEHGGGLKTYYFHLSEMNVEVDDVVTKGGLLGAVGSTGYSTGPHLHFEVRIANQSINPELLFEDTAGLYSFAE